MAVPKTTENRCSDGSVQARKVVQRLCKYVTTLHCFVHNIILWGIIRDY